MKAAKKTRTRKIQKSYGLVANGSAGSWQVDVDETLTGSQQWFAQIQGPTCYLCFEIKHPRSMAEILALLTIHLRRNQSRTHALENARTELKLARCGLHEVEILCEPEAPNRCFILVKGDDQFRLRATLSRRDVESLAAALEQVCQMLRHDELIAEAGHAARNLRARS